MHRIALGAIALLGLSLGQNATAGATWTALSIATTPQNAPKILAAANRFMKSDLAKDFPGRLLLQMHVADGRNPATHTFVPIYKNAAEREEFVQGLQGKPAWDAFLWVLSKYSQPVASVRYQTVRSWGEVVDTDHVWMGHAFTVRDPAAFIAAAETFLKSATGQEFPGQVHLSAVVAGGLSPVTHFVSVGYASEAEMEAWATQRNASEDWADYLEAARESADYLGGSLARDIRWWGPATLADLAAD